MQQGCYRKFDEQRGAQEPETKPGQRGNRDARTLPFSKNAFRLINREFHTHGSIARTVSRANVPMFSQEQLHMTEMAYGKISFFTHELCTEVVLTSDSIQLSHAK